MEGDIRQRQGTAKRYPCHHRKLLIGRMAGLLAASQHLGPAAAQAAALFVAGRCEHRVFCVRIYACVGVHRCVSLFVLVLYVCALVCACVCMYVWLSECVSVRVFLCVPVTLCACAHSNVRRWPQVHMRMSAGIAVVDTYECAF